jgi:hypothetical protein
MNNSTLANLKFVKSNPGNQAFTAFYWPFDNDFPSAVSAVKIHGFGP